MPMLIEKGYYKRDYRSGLPPRNVLRGLEDQNLLFFVTTG